MSKELEYIQRQIDIIKQQVKGSKMKIIVTDTITKHRYDYYENELQTLESIEQALQRLESIDNSNPSEALECLEEMENYNPCQCPECYTLGEWCREELEVVKQALLKAQEPKQYLKWEDLEFKITHKIRILMNDNLYNLFCYDEKYIEIRTIKGEFMLTLDNDNPEDKQFFNDLHLERVEE